MAKVDVNDIVTDELSTGIGQMQRNDLVNNFKIIKEILTELSKSSSNQNGNVDDGSL